MAVIPFQYPFSFVGKAKLNLGYVLSGYDSPVNYGDIQEYNFDTSIFQNMGTQPKTSARGHSMQSDKAAYMSGGGNGQGTTSDSVNTAAKFDFASKTGTFIGNAPQASGQGFSTSSRTNGYVLGGRALGFTFAYDQKLNFSSDTIASAPYNSGMNNCVNNTQTETEALAFYAALGTPGTNSGIASYSTLQVKRFNFSTETLGSAISTSMDIIDIYASAGFSSTTNVYTLGANFGTSSTKIYKFNIVANTTTFLSNISYTTQHHRGFHNKARGIFSGGSNVTGSPYSTDVARSVDFATDTITITGPLTRAGIGGFASQTQTFG